MVMEWYNNSSGHLTLATRASTALSMLEALRLAERALLAAYGEPSPLRGGGLENLRGRDAIVAVRAAIAKAESP